MGDLSLMTIVIAWPITLRRAVDWKSTRIDMGHRPPMEEYTEIRCVTWLLSGDASDIDRAKVYAKGIDGARVFAFEASEPEPHERAKAEWGGR